MNFGQALWTSYRSCLEFKKILQSLENMQNMQNCQYQNNNINSQCKSFTTEFNLIIIKVSIHYKVFIGHKRLFICNLFQI